MPYDVVVDIGLLSPERTPVFDQVAETARRLFQCAACFISVIDEPNDRQFFKAQAERRLPLSMPRETPLAQSLCKTVVADGTPLIIDDARRDIRFRAHPAVAEQGVVAYLGVPIRAEAKRPLAALCLRDNKARAWTPDDVRLLQALADGVSNQIERMIETRGLDSLEPAVEPAEGDCVRLSLVQLADGQEELVAAPAALERLWGLTENDAAPTGAGLFFICLPEDLIRARASMGRAAACLAPWQHVWRIETPSGAIRQLHGHGLPTAHPGGCFTWEITLRDVTEPPT